MSFAYSAPPSQGFGMYGSAALKNKVVDSISIRPAKIVVDPGNGGSDQYVPSIKVYSFYLVGTEVICPSGQCGTYPNCAACPTTPDCVDNGACTAANTCSGLTCTTNCGATISGTKTCTIAPPVPAPVTVTLDPNLKWKNLNDDEITTAQINDYVVLFFGAANSGINLKYSIVNDKGVEGGFGNTNSGYVIWKALAGNYTFKITADDGATWRLSPSINFLGFNDAVPNPVRISSPANRAKYMNGSAINFNQLSKDEDDLLNLKWAFGNGSYSSISDYSFFERHFKNNNLGDIQVIYSTPGVYNINLSANEKDRSLKGANYTTVIVLQEGVNVVPLITAPVPWVKYSKMVTFNASETFVANCSANMAPFNFTTVDGGLKCIYLHAPLSYRGANLPSSYNLTFNWTLDDGRNIVKKWNAKNYYDGAVEFLYKFDRTGEHTTKLSVSYDV